jgi:hypothetical protein
MARLRQEALRHFGSDCAEKRIWGTANFAVDFWFPEDKTIVEIAMSLRNPLSEYERDLFKALLALETGHTVERLVLFAKPGAKARCSRPGIVAITQWVEKTAGIKVEIREFTPPEVEEILDDTTDA